MVNYQDKYTLLCLTVINSFIKEFFIRVSTNFVIAEFVFWRMTWSSRCHMTRNIVEDRAGDRDNLQGLILGWNWWILTKIFLLAVTSLCQKETILLSTSNLEKYIYIFWILNFRRDLNILCFRLGNSPASEFYIQTPGNYPEESIQCTYIYIYIYIFVQHSVYVFMCKYVLILKMVGLGMSTGGIMRGVKN